MNYASSSKKKELELCEKLKKLRAGSPQAGTHSTVTTGAQVRGRAPARGCAFCWEPPWACLARTPRVHVHELTDSTHVCTLTRRLTHTSTLLHINTNTQTTNVHISHTHIHTHTFMPLHTGHRNQPSQYCPVASVAALSSWNQGSLSLQLCPPNPPIGQPPSRSCKR